MRPTFPISLTALLDTMSSEVNMKQSIAMGILVIHDLQRIWKEVTVTPTLF
jgi:hypothetical protein